MIESVVREGVSEQAESECEQSQPSLSSVVFT